METKLERARSLEEQIDNVEHAYAQECVNLYNQKGFDEYSPKWQKKISKLAGKYAEILLPLKAEHEELVELIAIEQEEIRKKKYKDVY